MMRMHWAAHLIGEPWTPAHDCWWLVQHYFRERHGIEMPRVHVGGAVDESRVPEILAAARSSGWVPVGGPPREDDVVLMRNELGERHVGVMTRADGRMKCIHSSGSMRNGQPIGSVVAEPLDDMRRTGCKGFEFWRRQP